MALAARQENKSSKGWSTQHTYVVNRYSHVIIKSALLSVLVIMKECQTSMAYSYLGLLLTFVLILSQALFRLDLCICFRGRTQIDSFTHNVHWTFSNTPTPLPRKRPIENRCNFSDHEKISNRCFAAYQMGLSANEVVSDVLSMTMLNENGQDMSLLSKFFHINNIYSKRKLQTKVSCRKFSGEMSIKQNF